MSDEKHAFNNGSGMTDVMTVDEMIAEIQRLGRLCERYHAAVSPPQNEKVMERTGATEVDAVSVSVPAPQLPHDATKIVLEPVVCECGRVGSNPCWVCASL